MMIRFQQIKPIVNQIVTLHFLYQWQPMGTGKGDREDTAVIRYGMNGRKICYTYWYNPDTSKALLLILLCGRRSCYMCRHGLAPKEMK
jgi:hypothetical protein